MNGRKLLLAVLAVLLIRVVAGAVVVSVYRFYLPQTVTVAVTATPRLRVMIDYSILSPEITEWKNGTRLNWGTLPRGVNVTKDLTVYNLNDYSVTVYLIADLPPWW